MLFLVNDAYLLSDGDVLYACDYRWWRKHVDHVRSLSTGELWTQCKRSAREFGLKRVVGYKRPGLSTSTDEIHFGDNSGYQAINLAVNRGHKRIGLLGFNMGRSLPGDRSLFFWCIIHRNLSLAVMIATRVLSNISLNYR